MYLDFQVGRTTSHLLCVGVYFPPWWGESTNGICHPHFSAMVCREKSVTHKTAPWGENWKASKISPHGGGKNTIFSPHQVVKNRDIFPPPGCEFKTFSPHQEVNFMSKSVVSNQPTTMGGKNHQVVVFSPHGGGLISKIFLTSEKVKFSWILIENHSKQLIFAKIYRIWAEIDEIFQHFYVSRVFPPTCGWWFWYPQKLIKFSPHGEGKNFPPLCGFFFHFLSATRNHQKSKKGHPGGGKISLWWAVFFPPWGGKENIFAPLVQRSMEKFYPLELPCGCEKDDFPPTMGGGNKHLWYVWKFEISICAGRIQFTFCT